MAKHKTYPFINIYGSSIIGIIAAAIRERKRGIIYELNDLKSNIDLNLYGTLFSSNPLLNRKIIDSNLNLRNNNIDYTKICFTYFNKNISEKKKTKAYLPYGDSNYLNLLNIEELENYETIILIVEPQTINIQDLKIIEQTNNYQ